MSQQFIGQYALTGSELPSDFSAPFGSRRYVSAGASIQDAVDAASAGDVIFIAPGEYDENVLIETEQITLIGAGPRHSVRITGTLAGTATGVTINGVNEVGLYNLNMEGRTGGSGLAITGSVRRIQVAGCKMHSGDQAVLLDGLAAQIVDVRIEHCVIGLSAIGVKITASGGGDPTNQVLLKDNYFLRITADCILTAGFAVDLTVIGNTFANVNGVEPTRFLDIDDASTTGFVANNVFATTLFSTAKFAIAAGVLFANNVSQAENPSAAVGGTSGRPDA